jgi:hypothetical protein
LIPGKAQADGRRTAAAVTSDRSAIGGVQPEVLKAIEDLKLFIQKELRILREEIQKLRE